MGTVVTDDDSSEWSIEIFDGNCAPCKPTKSVKQTPPTSSKPASKQIHPFFLKDLSTKAGVSERNETNSESAGRAAGQKRSKHIYTLQSSGNVTASSSDAPRMPGELITGVCHASALASVPNRSMAVKQLTSRENLTYNLPLHEQLPKLQKKRDKARDTDTNGLSQIARNVSSSSSIPTSSTSGLKNGEPSLPIYNFMDYPNPPAVVYIQSESQANELVQTLKGPLGFDLEWRVMWQPGAQERRTALVQLCDTRTILLIQVSSMKRFPKGVIDIIESANIVKTGANILNDGEKLYRDFGIRAKGLVELGAFATKADDNFCTVYNRDIVSLAKMVAMYLGKTLTKGKVRTSNWEAHLTSKMVEYAANDCHCALMVYNRLQAIAVQAGKHLDVPSYSRQVDPRSLNLKDVTPSLPQTQNTKPASASLPDYCIPEPLRPQWLRAYKLWHVDRMSLQDMCMTLRTAGRVEPLKESTVISYVVSALQGDPRLPVDMRRLKELIRMEASSWQRHRQWVTSRE